MNNTEQIGDLMFRYMRNELNVEEISELEAWRKSSPMNEKVFQEAMDPERMREDLKALEESRITRLESRISRLRKSTMHESEATAPTRSMIRRVSIGILKIAAILLLGFFIIVGVSIYRFKNAHKHPVPDSEDRLAAIMDFSDLLDSDPFSRGFLAGTANLDITEEPNHWLIGKVPDTTKFARDVYYRLFTSDGNHLLLNYSDSTHIWLNSNATIKYPSWQRIDSIHIFLTGEAYVHIPSGTKHTYIIKISPPVDNSKPSAFLEAVADKTSRSMFMFTNGGDLHLKSYFGGNATTATLISGSLRIDSVGGKSVTPINLEPGQQAKLDSGRLEILKPEHITDSLSWKP